MLIDLPKTFHKDCLVGYEHSDDAAVIKMTEDLAIIQTLDFFPPMITDPYFFGQIAAANALSDVYAMGGQPVLALNIVAFPETGNYDMLKQIMLGGAEKVKEAGAVLAGGHSINDTKPKYGLSVMGKVHPDKIWANCQTQIDDVLFLTKPLGVGIIISAYGAKAVGDDVLQRAIDIMKTLNKSSAEILHNFEINSCTDITGFGFLGHVLEMLGDDKTALIYADAIPYIDEAYHAAKHKLITGGAKKNRLFLKDKFKFEIDDVGIEEILFDPQTSGGLLFSVNKTEAEKIRAEFNKKNIPLWEVGKVQAFDDVSLIIK